MGSNEFLDSWQNVFCKLHYSTVLQKDMLILRKTLTHKKIIYHEQKRIHKTITAVDLTRRSHVTTEN